MKHVRKISKNAPVTAWWWNWFGKSGELKGGGSTSPKATYINALWHTVGSLDPRDV